MSLKFHDSCGNAVRFRQMLLQKRGGEVFASNTRQVSLMASDINGVNVFPNFLIIDRSNIISIS